MKFGHKIECHADMPEDKAIKEIELIEWDVLLWKPIKRIKVDRKQKITSHLLLLPVVSLFGRPYWPREANLALRTLMSTLRGQQHIPHAGRPSMSESFCRSLVRCLANGQLLSIHRKILTQIEIVPLTKSDNGWGASPVTGGLLYWTLLVHRVWLCLRNCWKAADFF